MHHAAVPSHLSGCDYVLVDYAFTVLLSTLKKPSSKNITMQWHRSRAENNMQPSIEGKGWGK